MVGITIITLLGLLCFLASHLPYNAAQHSTPDNHYRDNALDWWEALRRIFKQFAWLEVDSVKMTDLVPPTSPHQDATRQVTPQSLGKNVRNKSKEKIYGRRTNHSGDQ